MLGYLVYSKAGHDKGEIYLVINEDERYVWLVNGLDKKIQNPKKKNKKHVQLIKVYYEINDLHLLTNEQVKYHIKKFDSNKI